MQKDSSNSSPDPIEEIEAAKAAIDGVVPQLAQASMLTEPILRAEPAGEIERDAAAALTDSLQGSYEQLKEASDRLTKAKEGLNQENEPPPPPSTQPDS